MMEVIPAGVLPVNSVDSQSKAITALALQLGYEGDLSLGALEDGIRFYQQRTIEALFEMGKRLLLLKESTPHGDFAKRAQLLGFNDMRAVQRTMSATLRFSNAALTPHLEKIGNKTKLIEMLVLDDEDISELAEGGSVGGLTLDKIETLSSSELRQELRAIKADADAKDQIIRAKDEKLNKQDAELSKLQSSTQIKKREQTEQQKLELEGMETLKTAALTLITAIARFQNEVSSVQDAAMEHNLFSLGERAEETVITTLKRVAQLSADFSVQVDFQDMVNPMWLFPDDNTDIEEPELIYSQQDAVEG